MYDWNTIVSKIDASRWNLVAAFYLPDGTYVLAGYSVDRIVNGSVVPTEYVVWNLVPSVESPANDFVGQGLYTTDVNASVRELTSRIGHSYVSILSV